MLGCLLHLEGLQGEHRWHLGEEDGDWVGRRIPKKGCRLRRTFVSGRNGVGVLGDSGVGTVRTKKNVGEVV